MSRKQCEACGGIDPDCASREQLTGCPTPAKLDLSEQADKGRFHIMASRITEVWKTTTPKGAERYWRFCTYAGRALPVKRADAELGLATGTHTLTTKPEWVGK